MILLVLHAAQAISEARARLEEEKPQSERPARPGAEKVEKEIAIVNRLGLHLRHAARFAQVANRFRGDIWVAKDGTDQWQEHLGADHSRRRSRLRPCFSAARCD
jgi:hypothetical protein